MKREQWKSRVGFMWAAIGSAVGLGSIWRFPYVVGQSGGAAFVLLFCFFLVFISLPVLIAEILIGRKTQLSPCGAYRQLGKGEGWAGIGLMTIVTGFIVSSFYSVICGWTLGYLLDALGGSLTSFQTIAEAKGYYNMQVTSPLWAVGTHFGFMFFATLILYIGVRDGIESGNKILMPLLFLILVVLVIKGLTMKGAEQGLEFLFSPDWKSLTPSVVVMALGQAFFGLSIGQGTMVTYGSYLSKKENIPGIVVPISMAVVLVSILAGVAIFTVVFSVGAVPEAGANLMFQTLPLVFSQIPGGYYLAILFFLLIFVAGLTSQISAMEPAISYLIDEKKWPRHRAVTWVGIGAFALGIPSALAFGAWKEFTLFGYNFFDAISYLSINILVPLGGLASVLLLGWRWGIKPALDHLNEGAGKIYRNFSSVRGYLKYSIKYFSPIIIALILLNLLGLI